MSASNKGQIDSAEGVIGEVFWRIWFRVSDNQRAWGKDEISELIDDLTPPRSQRGAFPPRATPQLAIGRPR